MEKLKIAENPCPVKDWAIEGGPEKPSRASPPAAGSRFDSAEMPMLGLPMKRPSRKRFPPLRRGRRHPMKRALLKPYLDRLASGFDRRLLATDSLARVRLFHRPVSRS